MILQENFIPFDQVIDLPAVILSVLTICLSSELSPFFMKSGLMVIILVELESAERNSAHK